MIIIISNYIPCSFYMSTEYWKQFFSPSKNFRTSKVLPVFGAQFETELSDKKEMELHTASNHIKYMKFQHFRLYLIIKERSVLYLSQYYIF